MQLHVQGLLFKRKVRQEDAKNAKYKIILNLQLIGVLVVMIK
jgi:hypothetical protein